MKVQCGVGVVVAAALYDHRMPAISPKPPAKCAQRRHIVAFRIVPSSSSYAHSIEEQHIIFEYI